MAIFRPREPLNVRPSADQQPAQRPPTSLWADTFGRLSTRSLQILIVALLATALVWVNLQLTLVTIPLVLALIFAAAFAPAMAWMRRRGVPAPLATIISLFAVLLILGGFTWLIVWAVSDQWSDLAQQAQEGFGRLTDQVQTLPFAPTPDQFSEWTAQLTDFLTSSQFGSSALRGVNAITNFVTGLVLLVTILFFFLKDGPQMWEFVLRPFRGASLHAGATDRRQDDRHPRVVRARNGARRARRRDRHPDRPADPAGAARDPARGADLHPRRSSRSSERCSAGSSPRWSLSSRTAG